MQKELIDYIKRCKSRGFSKEQIRNALVKARYDITTVNEHLNYVHKKTIDKNKILIPSLIIFLLVLSVGFYFLKTATPENKVRDYLNLGWDLYNQDKYEESIIQFNNAIELNPEIESSYRGLGWSYYKLEDYEKAIENFEKAVETDPNSDNAYDGLGRSYHLLENYEKAIENFNHIQNVNGDYKILNLLGRIYLEIEDNEKAKEMYDKSLLINETFWEPYIGFGRYYSRISQFEQSKSNYEKAFDLNPNQGFSYAGIGWVYFQQENYEKAKEYLYKALEINPDNEVADLLRSELANI